MSWLRSVGGAGAAANGPSGGGDERSLLKQFMDATVLVERDLESGRLVLEEADGHRWVVAYATYRLLETLRGDGDEVDHTQMPGRALKERVPREVGILYRPNRDDEITIQWPKSAPVARISVQ